MIPPSPHAAHHIFTLLGIRFWDPVESAPVRDGLVVRAWPENYPIEKAPARPSGAGIYVFPRLPGMHDLEFPRDGAEPWSAPSKTFVVEAVDARGRFLPLVFLVPVPHQGVFPNLSLCSPPYGVEGGCVLFSAPTRPVLPGWAVIRASLVDADTEQPATYALLEVRINGQVWHGISGENGNVLVVFPYPHFFDQQLFVSPLAPVTQSWDLRVQIKYQPAVLEHLVGSPHPTLKSIFAQNTASISATSPAETELLETLVYPKPLVLHSLGKSSLWIDPAATSP